MHLKSLEMIGFKSFAARTLLEFGSGMTAIVGPNGCGKSNIADAVRWVLGEQSAKLLRGSKMEDCIFNGTDNRKPLGMAEVSLTLADCEKNLQTDYHEITMTRRVFRSGEGQYFINKTPCRLKDIRRLFMDTGIGTTSYSLMEQGRIDLILSSRPEDRREIFEEASGITKYKTDKREALRKLDQTEANLLRLADIIKEVKRQIISLQRQAGKATRVKKLKQELRSLDIYVSRGRLQTLRADLQRLETRMAALDDTIEAFQKDIADGEQQGQSFRAALSKADAEMDTARQSEMDFNAQLQQTRQSIEINQRRVTELQDMIRRDAVDMESAIQDIAKQRQTLEQIAQSLKKAEAELAASEANLRDKSAKNTAHEQILDQVKQTIQKLHTESMELDDKGAKFQNELSKLETEGRTADRERERRAAEQTNLTHIIAGLEKRLTGFAENLQKLADAVEQAKERLAARQNEHAEITRAMKNLEQQHADAISLIASQNAQIQMLNTHLAKAGAFPAGAQQLLDTANPLGIDRTRLVGSLIEQVETTVEFRTALEAALRYWAGSVVVADWPDALTFVRQLENGAEPVQLLTVRLPDDTESRAPIHPAASEQTAGPGVPLLDQVACPAAVRPMIERLLASVRVIDSLDQLPARLSSHSVFVTRQGTLVNGAGVVEHGYAGNRRQFDNPLARKHTLQELQETIARLQTNVQTLDSQRTELAGRLAANDETVRQSQRDLDTKHQALARQEGEGQVIAKETSKYRERLETVRWEFQELEKQGSSVEARSTIVTAMDRIRARRVEIKMTLETQNRELHRLEQDHKHLYAEVMQANVQMETGKQSREHLQSRHTPLAERIAEQEHRAKECTARMIGYQSDIESLTKAMENSRASVPSIEEKIQSTSSRLTDIRKHRTTAEADWKKAEVKLKTLRDALDEHRNQRQEINGQCIELRMKHQNLVERIVSEYRIAADAIALEPEPEWPENKPDAESLDNTIAEMRAKIEAIGPVYEGAIEEYEQLQERFTFLNQQQNDLVKSKQQLMDMIRKINQTTIEMFTRTFEAINANFQTTFKQLFGGGSAKLMLADDEDILESGIEIIARPPGKRLQSISLLSGGERTMTAVALLFAIYMVKPSPFCMLDELDAALDEPNNRRFIKMLKGFLTQSQFIMITHNQQTIATADVIYGATMQESGVSRIVSMKFSQNAVRPDMETAEPEPIAESEAQGEPVMEPVAVAATAPAVEPAAPSGNPSGE